MRINRFYANYSKGQRQFYAQNEVKRKENFLIKMIHQHDSGIS